MLDDKMYPTYLCIEVDLLIKNKDTNQLTQKISEPITRNTIIKY